MRKSYERYGAVTYYQIKVTDAEQTEKMQKKGLSSDGSHLSGGEDHRGSCKVRVQIKQRTKNGQ